MDPNETLKKIRQLVKKVYCDNISVSDDANELADLVESLDNWLSRGGWLPKDWERKNATTDK